MTRHRNLLDGWLAKGDTGAGEESALELKMASHEKWGIGVNAEYEAIRKDSDGDGISDTWEELNDRDPADGKLIFEFDCGAWQTEGWKAHGKLTNIAGSQGFLDFDLIDGRGGIQRSGLKVNSSGAGKLQIRLRSSGHAGLTCSVNGNKFSDIRLQKDNVFSVYDLIEQPISDEFVESLQLNFLGQPGTTIEIDWIK